MSFVFIHNVFGISIPFIILFRNVTLKSYHFQDLCIFSKFQTNYLKYISIIPLCNCESTQVYSNGKTFTPVSITHFYSTSTILNIACINTYHKWQLHQFVIAICLMRSGYLFLQRISIQIFRNSLSRMFLHLKQ